MSALLEGAPQAVLDGERPPRTEQGALLRSGLDAIKRQALAVPDDRRVVVAAVYDGDGVEVGAAFLTSRGWTLEGNVRAEFRNGKRLTAAVKFIF